MHIMAPPARPVLAAAPSLASTVRSKCRVLFCTRQFPWSAKFTSDIFAEDPDVEVTPRPTPLQCWQPSATSCPAQHGGSGVQQPSTRTTFHTVVAPSYNLPQYLSKPWSAEAWLSQPSGRCSAVQCGVVAGTQVVQCDSEDVAASIRDAHVAVPFMAQLDDATLAHARNLKLIIQYGVGVEGVDIPAVGSCTLPSRSASVV